MYQYRGYAIQQTKNGEVIVRTSSGEYHGQYVNTREAEESIDDLLDSAEDIPHVVEEDLYYVYRIAKQDIDKYSNYQYYNGTRFLYNVANIKYLTKTEAEKVVRQYRWDDYCNYYIRKKGQR